MNNSDIEDLQTRIAFQEDIIDALNKRVNEQQSEINNLHLQLQHIYKKVQTMAELVDAEGDVDNQPPPHY